MAHAIEETLERVKRQVAKFDRPERRALTGAQTTTTTGGYVVGDAAMARMVYGLRTGSCVRRLARVETVPTGAPYPIPTIDESSIVAALMAENQVQATSDPSFGQTVLISYQLRTSVVCSHEFWTDTQNQGDVLQILAERLGRLQNQYYTVGTGSAQPTGIVNAASNSTISVAAAPTMTTLLDIKNSIDPAYLDDPNARCAMMMHPTIWLAARKLAATDTLWQTYYKPRTATDPYDRIDGLAVIQNADMPTAGTGNRIVVAGDFSRFLIRDTLQPVELFVSRERFAEQHSWLLKAVSRTDSKLLVSNAMKYAAQA